MKKIKKSQRLLIAGLGVILIAIVVYSIYFGMTQPSEEPESSKTEVTLPVPDEANQVRITLKQDGSESSGGGVSIADNTVTISRSGTYLVSGTLENGKLRVDAGEKDTVILLLDGVNITNPSDAAIDIKSVGHTSIQIKEGTENQLQSGTKAMKDKEEDSTEQEAKGAAIDANGDLSIAGTGSLQILGCINDGIMSKKTVLIENGKLTIESKGDAVQADTMLKISGGDFSVLTGKGSSEASFSSDNGWGSPDSGWDMSEESEASTKGFKSGTQMWISGGTFTVDSYDDSFHSNGSIAISGGTFSIASGDDGIHADTDLKISGGKIQITKSYEGLESNQITIEDGEIGIAAADDGMNANGGSQNSRGGGPGKPREQTAPEATDSAADQMPNLKISGGTISVNADGDGLDSNGNLMVEGGLITVNGPVSDGNGALDVGSENGGTCTISGGTILALGSSGMAETFGEDSKQCSFLYNLESAYEKGAEIIISNEDGKELFRYTAVKAGSSVVFSSPELVKGENYILSVDGKTEKITMDSVSQSYGSRSRTPGGRPGMGGPDGNGKMRNDSGGLSH